MYRHKSGSQKRKEREEREQKKLNAEKGQSTLTSFQFYKKATSSDAVATTSTSERADEACAPSPLIPSLSPIEKTSDSKNSVGQSAEVDEIVDVNNSSTSLSAKHESGMQLLTSEHDPNESKLIYDYDIGTIETDNVSPQESENVIRRGHQKNPTDFPRDRLGKKFSLSLLFRGDKKVPRDWLVWSHKKSAFFCLPCRLFHINQVNVELSSLCTPEGYSKNKTWHKLYEKLRSHENNNNHVLCYLKWRELETRIKKDNSIDKLLREEIKSEAEKWRQVLTRILDTILFLGERGLALRGDSHLLGEKNNGNFLGILELISHYDPILRDHLEKVKTSQQLGQRLQVHYLSSEIQNEFINLCSSHVKAAILKEREEGKYYSIIVDATPDSAHIEQTTFILRYLHLNPEEKRYTIYERFLAFVNCNKKTGADIADLIKKTLEEHNIPLDKCRGQGYDNGSNMKGQYEGAQSHILRVSPLAVYSPCGNHSLNLVGVDSAQSCTKAITFFGVVQKFYNILSSSPQRWEILKKHIHCSFHRLSDTRWSARVDAIKPFANTLPKLDDVLEEVKTLNLTPETKRDVDGLQKYIHSFECILMSSIWSKVLTAINERSVILQARNATIDVEVANLKSLLSDLEFIRNRWDAILTECKVVANQIDSMSLTLPTSRKRKRVRRFSENEDSDSTNTDEETNFKINTFLVIIDSVISGISNRFKAMNDLNDTFSFLWQFNELSEENLRIAASNFVEKYICDVSEDLGDELIHLKHVYEANFKDSLSPFDLLSKITSMNLDTIFSNICTALCIFCTIPVSVASGERSFSVLARIKNYLRSCSTQERVTGLGTLCLESDLARTLDFQTLIESFASAKARKAHLG